MLVCVGLLLLCALVSAQDAPPTSGLGGRTEQDEALRLLGQLDKEGSEECNRNTKAAWAYESDITEAHKAAKLQASVNYARWEKSAWEKINQWRDKWPRLADENLRRQFKLQSVLGTAALEEHEFKQYESLITEMSEIYSTAKVCDFKDKEKCDLNLEPELTRLLRTSRDYDELQHLWESWSDASGKKIRKQYLEYVQLGNKAAMLNNFKDMSEMWLFPWESDTFRSDVIGLWSQLKPLYEQLHAYVRRRLREVYGPEKITARGPIPVHLVGNMWAQSWSEIYKDILIPFPNKTSVDVTDIMKQQNYTPLKMFELSDEFFTSLNLTKMPQEFWSGSIIEKPKGRELTCHASAWDFCDGKDVRIKQCTDVTQSDLITVHHEMGHIMYFLQYAQQPSVFRTGANEGFHEAIGDTIALSVSTPKHLHKINLLPHVDDDPEADINFLMSMALDKVAFIPFGYLIDLWRWDVFSGQVPEEEWNCHWWNLRFHEQGVKPPRERSERDFDPGAKYHVPSSVPYIRYFASHILQFQFHKALCQKAGQYDPRDPAKALHKCDIYQSKEAGNALGSMLQEGASKPWPDTLHMLTGTRRIDASALREYFQPLEEWLADDNSKHREHVGWEKDGDYCSKEGIVEVSSGERVSATLALTFICLLQRFL